MADDDEHGERPPGASRRDFLKLGGAAAAGAVAGGAAGAAIGGAIGHASGLAEGLDDFVPLTARQEAGSTTSSC